MAYETKASSPTLLAEKQVLFHGIWVAGYRVSDSLVKTISTEFTSKPSRSCRLELTSAGLTLEVQMPEAGKKGKTNQIAFDSLRDFVVSSYDPTCLMVIYVDNNGRFSIMVCSSKTEKDLTDIARAFKDHRNCLLQSYSAPRLSSTSSANWTLRQNLRHSVDVTPHVFQLKDPRAQARSSISSETQVMTNGLGANGEVEMRFSRRSDASENEVFLEDDRVVVQKENVDLEREPVGPGDSRGSPEAWHVGIQASNSDVDSDSDSVTSATSMQSLKDELHSLSEEMKAIKFLLEKSTGISAEEYYMRRDRHGNRHAVAFHPTPRLSQSLKPNEDEQAKSANGTASGQEENHTTPVQAENKEDVDYDLRSIGMQTPGENNVAFKPRYAKKPRNGSSSNVYKEKKASVKKRNLAAAAAAGSANGSAAAGASSNANSHAPNAGSAKSISSTNGHQGSIRPIKSGSFTVQRPIESVYRHRSHDDSGTGSHRQKVVFMSYRRPASADFTH